MKREASSRCVTAYQAKTRFGQLLDEVNRGRHRFVVERRRRPIAVVLSIEDFEDLMEVGREQADPVLQKALHRAREEYRLGRITTLEGLYRRAKPA